MVNPYNISIFDSSPTIIYHPFREGEDVNSGWKSFYTGSPDSVYDNTFQNTNRGSGTSSHSTLMQGASFELSFMGTGVYIYGMGSGGGYTTTLDDGTAVNGAPGDSGILASYANLEYKLHKIVLEVIQSQALSLSSVLVTAGVGKTGAVVKPTTIDAVSVNPDGTSSLNENSFSTSGGGTNTRGSNDALAYPRVDTNAAGSSIIFRFNSASAVMVYGAVYHDHGIYTATLSPSAGASNSTRTFNATSKWFASDTLIYWESGLDRSQTYVLTLTNEDQNKYLDVSSVLVMDGEGGEDDYDLGLAKIVYHHQCNPNPSNPSNPTSKTSHNLLITGAIAGIAVGGVVAIALLSALVVFFRRRRRRTASVYRTDRMVKQVSRSNPHLVEPFVYQSVRPSPTTPNFAESPSHSRFNSFGDGSSGEFPPNFGGGIGTAVGEPSTFVSRYPQRPWKHSRDNSSSSSPSASRSNLPLQLTPTRDRKTSGSNNPSSSQPSMQRRAEATSTIRQETDAGPLPLPEEETVLPPGYNPEWESGRNIAL
ncbi:hypothetical protein L218DRAFT_1007610 [Marasmius fiardii PR-910]|nr:hypothetical protein L218DRAFT_1007610 [Marasmius fiardii PR-910]